MLSSYQVVLWKQESFVVLRPLLIEFFRNLLERPSAIAWTGTTVMVIHTLCRDMTTLQKD